MEKYTVKLLQNNPLYHKIIVQKKKKNKSKLEGKYTQLLAICEYKTKQLENIEIPTFILTRISLCFNMSLLLLSTMVAIDTYGKRKYLVENYAT